MTFDRCQDDLRRSKTEHEKGFYDFLRFAKAVFSLYESGKTR